MRKTAAHFLPKHTATTGWKHRNLSHVEQGSCRRCPSSAVWSAAETRGRVPWIGVDDPSEMQRLQAEHSAKMQIISNFQLGGSENLAAADDPHVMLCKKIEAWQISGTLTV